jgi:Ca2+-binding EF-hand superfamily protein
VISKDELVRLLRLSGMNPIDQFMDELLKEVDRDGNNETSFAEFVLVWDRYLARAWQETEVLELAFEFFDTDASQAISRDEFSEAMQLFGDPLTDEEMDEFLALVDKDGDGQVTFQEFMKLANAQKEFLRKAMDKHLEYEERLRREREERERLEREREAAGEEPAVGDGRITRAILSNPTLRKCFNV